MKSYCVGIVGFGNVGEALYYSLDKSKITNILIYDKYKDFGLKERILSTDILFITVPTPFNDEINEPDFNNVYEIFDYLIENNYGGIVVLKSTVYPNLKLSDYYEKLWLVSNPEFLNQNTRYEDALNQEIIILGGNSYFSEDIEEFYRDCLKNPNVEFIHCTFEEAMYFKYIRNAYSAYKVTFWNMVEQTIGNSRLYNKWLEKIPLSDKIIVGLDGEKGFGGKCLPKDLKTWKYYSDDSLLTSILKYNQAVKWKN